MAVIRQTPPIERSGQKICSTLCPLVHNFEVRTYFIDLEVDKTLNFISERRGDDIIGNR